MIAIISGVDTPMSKPGVSLKYFSKISNALSP
jgi:hypothetical protein